MEIHQLRYFCAVANTGNFTRAAEREYIAQPSLSQQIQKLEEELGAKLFDRLGREVRLTEIGKSFLSRAQVILKQISDAKQEALELTGVNSGQVSVGVIPTIAPYFLPPRIARFARLYPNVTLRVIEDITPELLEALREGTLDLAVVALPVGGREFVARELSDESLFAVLPESHKLANAKSVHVCDLDSEPFLLLKEGHCFRETVVAACKRARIPVNVVFESGQFATILAMVAAGSGVSIVPAMAVQEFKGCRFIQIDDERARRRIGVVHLKHHYLSKAQLALVDVLRNSRATGT